MRDWDIKHNTNLFMYNKKYDFILTRVHTLPFPRYDLFMAELHEN